MWEENGSGEAIAEILLEVQHDPYFLSVKMECSL